MLNREEIKNLIINKGLIENYLDLKFQLTPNGFDITVDELFEFNKEGSLDFSNKERIIPEGKKILPKKKNKSDKQGWFELKKGAYKIRTNETINLPNDLMALGFTRTSLLRIGAFCQNGVWDTGFKGRGEFLLVVENKKGLKLKQNARINQLIFFKIKKTKQGYEGIYKNL
jgi:dUTP pyrophosphatase